MDDFGGGEPIEEGFEDREFGLSPEGMEKLAVIGAVDRWLEHAPGGRLSLSEDEEAHVPMEVFVDGWNAGILGLLAASPLTSVEIGLALETLSRGSLREKLTKLSDAGLIEAQPEEGEGAVYAVTDWLREAVGPLLVAARCEIRIAGGGPVEADEPASIQTAFLLALPLLELPAELSGACRLLVDLRESGEWRAAGAIVRVEDGRVVSCSVGLEGRADSQAFGSADAWLEATIEGKAGELDFGGKGRLAQTVVQALHTRLFPNKTD